MIIVTGTIAYDYIMNFPGAFGDHVLPDQLHKINLSFIVDRFARRRGGTAGNVSYSLGLLGINHKLFSYAGKDFAEYKKAFRSLDIDLSGVKIDKKNYTSTGFAMTDNTDNQIWGYFYGASENISKLQLSKVADKNDLVLIGPSGAKGSLSFVKQCIWEQIPYMFDPGFILTQVDDTDLTDGIKHAKYIVGNDYEISLMKKRVKKWITLTKDKTIITTLGKKGAVITSEGRKLKIKPTLVKKVIDPTGAGDAWRAGFLTGLTKKFDLKTCGQMGSVAAAFAVEHYGTQEHDYSISEFKKRYSKTYRDVLDL